MVRRVEGAHALASPLEGSVVTLGTFDGVHLGHQALVARAVDAARAAGVPAVAYTFDPHPAIVLAPHAAPPLLVDTDERVRLLGERGADIVVVERFDDAFAQVTADRWVQSYLVERLRPERVVVGFNFTYGRGRGGDPAHLARAGERRGFTVDVVEPFAAEGDVVSSARIRRLLGGGDVVGAARLLGRPYALLGEVVLGDQRGRTIGFPTANVRPPNTLLPASGVYATRVTFEDQAHDAVTNIGTRPTFSGALTTLVESHLLDFAGDLYGRRLRIELLHRLRDERRFDGPAALVEQIQRDVEGARRLLA